ncbi:penicillin-binding protein 2 [Bacteriovorax sp. Seq25_V]|uniref:penicillin-binding protein 2 n=1 Tax=Bacteriovorax sp. Seq25_V TaxID=1201288 RepID=UPI00038A285F|nr:penicillin-binding protein 2 [Bacteriovorax sp. Seq25_V]EQC45332.1 penicillin-binding protein 2 [Bacteriovorax sp. Seq25_V]
MFGEEEVVKSHKGRADILLTLITLCFGIILIRLWYLQIYQGDMLYQYSLNNRLRKEVITAPRGMIFSRNNQLLVHNIPRFDAIIIPQYLVNKKQTLEKLSKILDMDVKDIEDTLAKFRGQAKYRPVRIKKNLSKQEVAIIETENEKMPGVQVETFISREYRDANVGSHLLGYISEISQSQLPKYIKRDNYDYKLGDFIGQAGVEEEFDHYLRGDDGYQFMEVDARGRMKRVISSNNLFAGIENKPATPGENIRLTIDRDLQLTAFNALEGKVGSVVAIDVNTGEVLSMVSRPSYDPTQFSRGLTSAYWASLVNDENNPLRDRTIQEHYPPGSTYKTFTAITALEKKLIKPDEELMCGPTFKLGRRTFHDWKKNGHGKTDVYKSLRSSVDVYFYKLAAQFDADDLAHYAKMFGLGAKTEITLPRETSGWIPTKEWKKKRFGVEWQLGENLIHAIGQGFNLVTPLQLALSYAAIANNGTVYRPQIIKEIFTNSGEVVKSFEPEVVSKAEVSQETLDAVKKGLYEVVNERKGTAWWYRGRGIRMAGKTGTAQVISMTSKELFSKCEEMPYRNRHHGLFVAFAPFDNPKIAVAAIVEHGCHGSSAGAPIVRDVMETYMKKYYPEDYERYAKEDKAAYLEMLRKEKEEKLKKEAEAAAEENTPAPSDDE